MIKKMTVGVFGVLIMIVALGTRVTIAQQEVELAVGDAAPTFVLRDMQDDDVFLRDFCGQLRQPWKNKTKHVVILSFFTSYCKPCLKEIPELQKIAAEFGENDLKVFLVNLKEDKELVQKYIAEKGFTLPVLLDRYGMIAKKYGVTSVPRIFIIDKEGNIAWLTKGYDEKLAENIHQALNELFE
ncbi:TlpA family protein disulfide reductase [candidate division KSB1 bacterium]|nr:TlpA family protein disulfide reductase [candidate division KSB1 bacterium]